jgi:hypothetical protein
VDRDDIIRMAREACDQAPREDWNSTAWVFGDETLERFAALVAAAEREACASICFQEGPSIDGELIAEAIRARGEK